MAGPLSTHSPRLHVAWLGAIVLVSLRRLGINLGFARAQPSSENLGWWRGAFAAGVALAGLI